MQERRQHPRVSIDVQVDCGGEMIAHAKDLSEGGICLISDRELPEGKMLDLRFKPSGSSEVIHAFGRVVRNRRASAHLHEIGVTFWQIDDSSRALLRDYLSARID